MTDTTISIADLRVDQANAEAEAAMLEERAKQARDRSARLAGMIQSLEEWAAERQERIAAPKAPPEEVQVSREPTSGEMAVRVLEAAGHTLTTRELADGMFAAGYRTTSQKKPVDAVYGVLTGAVKVREARLVKVGTKWGLREWVKEGGQQ